MEALLYVLVAISVIWALWYMYGRYRWYETVIKRNPKYTVLQPVTTNKSMKVQEQQVHDRVVAPSCNFRQYLKYLKLSCLPYAWSVPIKFVMEIFSRQTLSKLSECEKRQRLAKMILETSIVLGFRKKIDEYTYLFKFNSFQIPSGKNVHFKHFIEECVITVEVNEGEEPVLKSILVDGAALGSINEMFSFLNTLWCVYTHTLTHIQAGNIAEINTNDVQHRSDLSNEFKKTIDDMHAAVSGMNESANHYPADIWGIPRKQLQIILGYNGIQQIHNHQNIVHCYKISEFVNFTLKARKIFTKYLEHTGISISTLSANTIFHSIDHYNMGKYFLHDAEEKQYHGIDARMITSLLGDLNYDVGKWQGMKYSQSTTWQTIYGELKLINPELADKVHMFVSV